MDPGKLGILDFIHEEKNATAKSSNNSMPSSSLTRDAAETMVVDDDYSQGPEFPLNVRIVKEKEYRHDDQYQNYLVRIFCLSSWIIYWSDKK